MIVSNALTLLRLILSFVFALLFVLFPSAIAAPIGIFCVLCAALSDFLDGYLARKWGQVSAFGTMLDPIADKAFIIIALFVIFGLYGFSPLIFLPIVIITIREIFISGLREYSAFQNIPIPVSNFGKYKIIAQFAVVLLLLFDVSLKEIYPEPAEYSEKTFLYSIMWFKMVGIIALWATACLAVFSAWQYFLSVKNKIT